MVYYYPHNNSQPQITPRNNNKGRGIVIFGLSLIAISIIMALIGFGNKTLNPSGVAVSPGAAMIIFATQIAPVGIIITGIGIYISSKHRKP